MKLTKLLILLAAFGIFSACSDNPQTHQINPGGYTGENKAPHQNSPGHGSAGEKSGEHSAEGHSESSGRSQGSFAPADDRGTDEISR
ncbi:MAG: hypothetical protein WKF71_04705 [Pyrinomonadaceae bacterium]